MQKNVDVAAADAERGGDVFAGFLLEHAERDHGALRVAEPFDAGAEAYVLFGARHVLFGEHDVVLADGLVRPSHVVHAAVVSRSVAHDGREPRSGVSRNFTRRNEAQIRAECILYAVDRVLRAEPLAARDRHEPRTLGARRLGEKRKRIHARKIPDAQHPFRDD